MKGAKQTVLFFLFISVSVILSCSNLPSNGPEKSPEDRLRERATAFWNARLAGDRVEEYKFLEPALKKRFSIENFLQQAGGIAYHSFIIKRVVVKEDEGKVTVHFKWGLDIPGRTDSFEKESYPTHKWVLVDGEWYRTLKLPGVAEK